MSFFGPERLLANVNIRLLMVGRKFTHHSGRQAYVSGTKCQLQGNKSTKRSSREFGSSIISGESGRLKNWNRMQCMSSMTIEKSSFEKADPVTLAIDDIRDVYDDIVELLRANVANTELLRIATHLYMGHENRGISFMMLPVLIGKAVNWQLLGKSTLTPSQRNVVVASNMNWTSILLLDDVMDNGEEERRGKPNVAVLWKQHKPTIAGNVLHAMGLMHAGKYLNNDLTMTFARMSKAFRQGQFMQYNSGIADNERLSSYISKTIAKVAYPMSLMTKALVQAVNADYFVTDTAMKWTKCVIFTAMVLDDVVDLESDLKEGVATGPVLFACKEYPQLYQMIKRNFNGPGDVEKALELVRQSQGLRETQKLASRYAADALRHARCLDDSPHRRALEKMSSYFADMIEIGSDNKMVHQDDKKQQSNYFF